MEIDGGSPEGDVPDAAGGVPPSEPPAPSLLALREVDEGDELDYDWQQSSVHVLDVLNTCTSDTLAASALYQEASGEDSGATAGMLFAILVSESDAQEARYVKVLTAMSRDSFARVCALLTKLVMEKYHLLKSHCRRKLLRFTAHLMQHSAHDLDGLVIALLRHVVGGSVASENLWLGEELLSLFESHTEWVDSSTECIPYIVVTFLRMASDHARRELHSIQEREAALCCRLLREKFTECMVIGRDLVRYLQDVARVPAVATVWNDLWSKPSSFSPSFTNIAQLLNRRTPRKYIQSRIPPLMETHLNFLLSNVTLGAEKWYQTWIADRYFMPAIPNSPYASSHDPELSLTIIPDIIRYVCCVNHPPNHILCSDIIPRWVFIGWLLRCIKSNCISANAKLALMFDWFFFVPGSDNIMNIEPAMLLMMNSVPKYPGVTAMMLEFILLQIDHYAPSLRDLLLRGVHSSFKLMLKKGVVTTVEPLLSCPMHESVAAKVHKLLSPFMQQQQAAGGKQEVSPRKKRESADREEQAVEQKRETVPRGSTGAEGLLPLPQVGVKRSQPDSVSDGVADVDVKRRKLRASSEDVELGDNWMEQEECGSSDDSAAADSTLTEMDVEKTAANVKSEHGSTGELDRASASSDEDVRNSLTLSTREELEAAIAPLRDRIVHMKSCLERGESKAAEVAIQMLLASFSQQWNKVNGNDSAEAGRLCGVTAQVIVSALEPTLFPAADTAVRSYGALDAVFSVFTISRKNVALQHLVREMRSVEPCIGYHLLRYLCATQSGTDATAARVSSFKQALVDSREAVSEKEVATAFYKLAVSKPVWAQKSFEALKVHNRPSVQPYMNTVKDIAALEFDCSICAGSDSDIYFSLLPWLVASLRDVEGGQSATVALMKLACRAADPAQFNALVGRVSRGELCFLNQDVGLCTSLLKYGLEQEACEQRYIWVLCGAEMSKEALCSAIPPVLESMNTPTAGSEAMGVLRLLLPVYSGGSMKGVLKALLKLPPQHGTAVADTVFLWARETRLVSEDVEAIVRDLVGADHSLAEVIRVVGNLLLSAQHAPHILSQHAKDALTQLGRDQRSIVHKLCAVMNPQHGGKGK